MTAYSPTTEHGHMTSEFERHIVGPATKMANRLHGHGGKAAVALDASPTFDSGTPETARNPAERRKGAD
jgi:hypothetical protein